MTGLTARGETFVRSGVREDTERVVRAVRALSVLLARETVFSLRTAQSAPVVQNKKAQIKSKIFFISGFMLANLQNPGQVKLHIFI